MTLILLQFLPVGNSFFSRNGRKTVVPVCRRDQGGRQSAGVARINVFLTSAKSFFSRY